MAPELKVMPQLCSKSPENEQPPGTAIRAMAEQHWEADFFCLCDLNFAPVFWFIPDQFFSLQWNSLTHLLSQKSYSLKKYNSPSVSHFSLALQISSLEGKDLFKIITVTKKNYFKVFHCCYINYSNWKSDSQFLILQPIQTICIPVKEVI